MTSNGADVVTIEELEARVREGIEAEPFLLGTHSAALAALSDLAARAKACEDSLGSGAVGPLGFDWDAHEGDYVPRSAL